MEIRQDSMHGKTTMESIGGYLKREREFRNISLKEISRATKIRENILSALEEDRLDSAASPVFVKGFLRAYAKYVGLDPNEVILRYEVFLKEEEELKTRKAMVKTPHRWSLKYVVLPVSILLVLGGLLFLTLHRSMDVETESGSPQMAEPTEPPVQELKGDSVVPTPRKNLPVTRPPVHPSRPVPPPPLAKPSSVEVELRAVEDTWMQIRIDEGPSVEILLRHGESILRRGERKIEMKIGNAGGVVLTCNGKDLGKLGESGKVVHLSITPEEVKVGKVRGTAPQNP